MAGAVAQLVERGLVVVVGGWELPALGQHDLVALHVVVGAVARDVADRHAAVFEHPLGLLMDFPERLGWSVGPFRQPVGLLGVEHGVLAHERHVEALVVVDAFALVVPDGLAMVVGDGEPLPILEGEDARSPLALPHLSAPCLDLAVGPPSHVAVALLLLDCGQVQAVPPR